MSHACNVQGRHPERFTAESVAASLLEELALRRPPRGSNSGGNDAASHTSSSHPNQISALGSTSVSGCDRHVMRRGDLIDVIQEVLDLVEADDLISGLSPLPSQRRTRFSRAG